MYNSTALFVIVKTKNTLQYKEKKIIYYIYVLTSARGSFCSFNRKIIESSGVFPSNDESFLIKCSRSRSH